MMIKMKIYNKLPITFQNILTTIKGYMIYKKRFNSLYKEAFAQNLERDNRIYKDRIEYRNLKLKKIVKHCYHNVPYYTKLFNQLSIDYNDIDTLEDLKKIPVLTKKTVKENFKDFLATNIKNSELITKKTSGTTGTGFVFHSTEEAEAIYWGNVDKYYTSLGIKKNTWRAQFAGHQVVPIDVNSPPFYRIDYYGKRLLFSVYHMNSHNLFYYIESIKKHRLSWIVGYPSAITLLAKYINNNGIKFEHNIDYITLNSENISKSQSYEIENAFGVKPYQNYAQAEQVAVFNENKNHEMYVEEDFSAVEFIKDEKSDSYKIIGTNLNNYAMPLLRYDTNDLATYEINKNGRRILTLDGRDDDYIVLSDSTSIGRLAHLFKDLGNILEAQIIQTEIGKMTIKIVKGQNYVEKDEIKLKKEIYSRMGNKINFSIEYVNKIERTKNGKIKLVKSEIKS